MALDHDDFGLNQSKVMIETSDISDVSRNVIDSHNLERDAGGKPVPTFPHPALARWRFAHAGSRRFYRNLAIAQSGPVSHRRFGATKSHFFDRGRVAIAIGQTSLRKFLIGNSSADESRRQSTRPTLLPGRRRNVQCRGISSSLGAACLC
ncbi:MAG: hypothetical protein WCF20_12225 [Methylovirgula sp.]